jgi:hypothetical protein
VSRQANRRPLRPEWVRALFLRLGILFMSETVFTTTLFRCMKVNFTGRYDQLALWIALAFFAGNFWGYISWALRTCKVARVARQ